MLVKSDLNTNFEVVSEEKFLKVPRLDELVVRHLVHILLLMLETFVFWGEKNPSRA